MQQVIYQPALSDQIYAIVLKGICDGQYTVGERLSQEQIAHSLNVSRQPVLQALGLLKAQGFLCSAGRRGLMVAPLEPDFVCDLYEYRGAIDLLTASKAAQLCTPEQSTRGQFILDQGAVARKSATLVGLSMADMAFHQWVYQVAGNRTIMEMMNQSWNHIRRVMCAVLSLDHDWPRRAWEEHWAIYAAIVSRNSELAQYLAASHVENASVALQRQLMVKPQHTRGEPN